MTRDDILQLLAYNERMNDRIMVNLAQLSPEQLRAPANLDHGSAWQTLLHLVDTEWSWRLIAQQLPANQMVWEAENLPDLAAVQVFWHAEQARLRTYVQQMEEATLNGEVNYGSAQGRPPQFAKLWYILLHILNHSTQHRTELARDLTDCGHSPGELDLLEFLSP